MLGKVKIYSVLLLISLFLLTLFAGFVVAEEKIIKVGVSVCLTGKFAREGSLVKRGYDFWADYVNEQGGVKIGEDYHKVKMVYYDDASDAVMGNKLVEKLITQDKVNVVFSSYGSGITFATSAITERYKTLMISPIASADRLYARGYKYLFTSYTCDSRLAEEWFCFFDSLSPKPKTVGLLVVNDLWPLSIAEYCRTSAEKRGMEVFDQVYTKGTKDLTQVLLKIQEKKPDIIISCGYFQDAILTIQQARELNIVPKLFFTGAGGGLPDFYKILGKDADAIYGQSAWVPTANRDDKLFGSTENFLRLWEEKYNEKPLYFSVLGVAAGICYQRAVESAGTLESEKVREAMLSLDEDTFYNWLGFNEDGTPKKSSVGITMWKNGNLEYVWPLLAKTVEPIYPKNPWEE